MMAIKGFDAFGSVRSAAVAQQLWDEGYRFFGRYYRRAPLEGGKGNALSRAEAAILFARGFWAMAIYQNDSDSLDDFTVAEAEADAEAALAAARHHGQPEDTVIYFAVDWCPTPGQYPAIMAYFNRVYQMVWSAGYRVGVYGSGAICKMLREAGYVHKTWLSNAKSWPGYADWLPHADVVQTSLPHAAANGAIQVDDDVARGLEAAGMWWPGLHQRPDADAPPPPRRPGLVARIWRSIFG